VQLPVSYTAVSYTFEKSYAKTGGRRKRIVFNYAGLKVPE